MMCKARTFTGRRLSTVFNVKKLLYNNPNLPNVNPDKLLKITVIMKKTVLKYLVR